MAIKIWLNNKLVDTKDAKVPVFDRGFLYGDGVFETMRSYAGRVFRIDRHLARLFDSLKVMGFRSSYAKDELAEAAYRLIKTNRLDGAFIRLAITRGEGRFGIGYRDRFTPNVVIIAKEFEGYPEWMHKRGLRAGIMAGWLNENSPLCRIKSHNFLPYIMSRFAAKRGGFDEAILTNTKGRVAEASTSNVFIVKNNKLITPSLDTGILPGITRGIIIDIAKKLRIQVEDRAVRPAELYRADECFLTNSLAEVLPVISADKRRIGSGKPGELTRLLHISYQKLVIREIYRNIS